MAYDAELLIWTPDIQDVYHRGHGATAYQTINVYRPDKRSRWWNGRDPVLLINGGGGFSSAVAPTFLPHPSAAGTSYLNKIGGLALQNGIAVVGFGVTGPNSVDSSSIPGMGCFNAVTSTTEGYTGWDDVGEGFADGRGYPNDDRPSYQKDGVEAVQFFRSMADQWGLRTDLVCITGRSAGAQALVHPAFGPSRADGAMLDHRSEDSTVPLAIPAAYTFYFPCFDQSATVGAEKAFPDSVDPGEVAADLSAAGAVAQREFSGYRVSGRDYSSQGADVTGAAHRLAVGTERAVYCVCVEGDLGLVGTAPADALGTSGSDAANTKLPSLSDEYDIAHPDFEGIRVLSRMRELEGSTEHHTKNSRLAMAAASHAGLSGDDPAGIPLASLVSEVVQSGENAADGAIEWLMGQFDRLRGPVNGNRTRGV